MIDVKERLQKYSIDDFNRAAEDYFAKIKDRTYLLSKPFAALEECPSLLFRFSTLIQGLDLYRTMDVLDFGAGSCWTSHLLTQMGCKVHAVDVSPTALAIGRERYERHPPIGDQPAPTFSVYDGSRLPFPDQSMDRILCFDALHHVPNAAQLISEMGRVLKRDGIAGFCEPGPEHSKSNVSQEAMSTDIILENDIVIEDIWRFAQRAAFKRIELAVLSLKPRRISLSEYDNFLRRPGTSKVNSEIVASVNVEAGASRLFFLYKAETPTLTSLTREPLTADLNVALLAGNSYVALGPITAAITVKNTSGFTWLPGREHLGGVNLGCHVLDIKTGESRCDYFRSPLTQEPRPISPGERLSLKISIPGLPVGEYELEFDLVSELVCWFAQHGSRTCKFRITCREND